MFQSSSKKACQGPTSAAASPSSVVHSSCPKDSSRPLACHAAYSNHLAVANHIFDMNVFRPLARLAARPSSILPSPCTRAISSTPLPAAPVTSRRGGALELGDWIGRLGERSSGPPGIDLDTSTPQPHRMHVFATKHNTHITFTQPPKKDPANPGKQVDVLMSLSAGNIGFKKAGRGSYDAAYQLAAFVLKQIQERGLMRDLHSLEVVLRGFGSSYSLFLPWSSYLFSTSFSWPQKDWHGVGWTVLLRLLYITPCTTHPRVSHACTV